MYLSDAIGPGIHINNEDDFGNVDPDLLQQHYGIDRKGKARQEGQTGAGHPMDESDDEDEDDDFESEEEPDDLGDFPEEPSNAEQAESWRQVLRSQASQLTASRVQVPRKQCPFTQQELSEVFEPLLTQVNEVDFVPSGLGLRDEELTRNGWSTYPTIEILRSGRRGSRELRIALPAIDWRPRANIWGRALHVMNTMINEKNM